MRVLGLGGSDHDIASCIVQDGKIIAAIEDERISRLKYAIGSNLILGLSRKYCYSAEGLNGSNMDKVVIDDILAETAYFGVKSYEKINHHLAHAASCYYPSSFNEAALLVVDNAGSLIEKGGRKGIQTISYGIGQGSKIELLQTVLGENYDETRLGSTNRVYQRGDSDNSLGHFYKIVSGGIGFKFWDTKGFYYPEAGKTMGLAPYGDSRYYHELNSFITYKNNGEIEISLTDGKLETTINRILEEDGQGNKEFICKASIAWAAQKVLEEALVFCGEYLYEKTHMKKMCYSGGVALNCVANGKLLKQLPFDEIFIFPACGDNGTAVGCAYYGYFNDNGENGKVKEVPFTVPYFGKTYSDEEVEKVLNNDKIIFEKVENVAEKAAESIANNKIIAWYQGGCEFGPRALGHRSILADPRNPNIKDILNSRVKFREGFRPFAPSVLYDSVDQFFVEKISSPYMLFAETIKPEMRDKVPGIVHVDGTARLQTVTKEDNGIYADLIECFGKITGIPMIVNTSFNIKGEPICETPEDALKCFLKTDIDILYINNYVIYKKGV